MNELPENTPQDPKAAAPENEEDIGPKTHVPDYIREGHNPPVDPPNEPALPKDTTSPGTDGPDTLMSNDEDYAAILESAAQEADLYDMPLHEVAKKRLVDASPVAAESILWIAIHGTENNRLKAAQYILDRTFGKPGETGFASTKSSNDPFLKLMDKIIEVPAN